MRLTIIIPHGFFQGSALLALTGRTLMDTNECGVNEYGSSGANERGQTQTSVDGHKRVWMDTNARTRTRGAPMC